jgi:alpha-galactosidase
VLTLHVDDAGDGNYNDRADWAGLQLTCGAPVGTVPNGPWPHFVPQSSLSATATSAHPGYPASAAVDGKLTTIWHTEFAPPAPLPQSLTLDLGSVHNVAGLTYQPRLDTSLNGTITGYTVYISTDGSTFTKVMSGSWPSDRSLKSVTFSPQQARYIRLEATSGFGGYASAAEVDVADLPAS